MAGKGKGAIKLGIVGLGRAGIGMHMGELEAKGRTRKFKIVAACDPLKDRRDYAQKNYRCRTYRNIKDLLKDEEVQLVDIANPSSFHVADAKAALRSGKDVFLEKPIAVTYKGAKQLERAAGKAKGNLYIRHNRRFESAFVHIQEIISSGILGNVFDVRLCRLNYTRRDDWQTLKACGGGQLLNWGPHIVDHACQFIDSPVVDIWSDLKKVAAVGDAEDHLKIVLKGKNGRVATVQISGGSALSQPEFTVYGTKGALECTGNSIHMRYIDPRTRMSRRRARKDTPPYKGSFGSPDKIKWIEKTVKVKAKVNPSSIWDYLYDSIRKGRKFPITLNQALETMRIISEARKGTRFESRKNLV